MGIRGGKRHCKAEAKALVTEARSGAFLEMLEGVDIEVDAATFAHALSDTLNWRGATSYPLTMPLTSNWL